MNLGWVALVAVAVLVEKVAPRGDVIGRFAAGLVLFVAGVVVVWRGLIEG